MSLALVGLSCRGESDPNEFGRERGAVELVTTTLCRDGRRRLIDWTGGDIKTDWTAARQADGSYRVTLKLGAQTEHWRVDWTTRRVTAESRGAQTWLERCTTVAPANPG